MVDVHSNFQEHEILEIFYFFLVLLGSYESAKIVAIHTNIIKSNALF